MKSVGAADVINFYWRRNKVERLASSAVAFPRLIRLSRLDDDDVTGTAVDAGLCRIRVLLRRWFEQTSLDVPVDEWSSAHCIH